MACIEHVEFLRRSMDNDALSPYLESGVEDMEQTIQQYLRHAEEQAMYAPQRLERTSAGLSTRTFLVLGGTFALGMLLGVLLDARKKKQ